MPTKGFLNEQKDFNFRAKFVTLRYVGDEQHFIESVICDLNLKFFVAAKGHWSHKYINGQAL